MRLIISIHDISPGRSGQAQVLRTMVAREAEGPVSLLVIPRRHGRERWGDGPAQGWLARRAAQGDEVVLHGWSHTDGRGRDGAETTALAAPAVRALVARGTAELRALGLRPSGFIAPAYGRAHGLDSAIVDAGLGWWAGRARLRAGGGELLVPSVGLGASGTVKRALSPVAARVGLVVLARNPIVRLDLHTADVDHGRLLEAAGSLVRALLAQGRTLTTHGELLALSEREARGISPRLA